MKATSTHPFLNDQQLAMLEDMLREQEQFRTEQIAGLVSDDHDARTGRRTDAQHEIREALLLGAHVALTATRTAHERMASGTYGRCLGCDRRLTLEQLEILPHSTLCAACRHLDAS